MPFCRFLVGYLLLSLSITGLAASSRISQTPLTTCKIKLINYWPEDILIDIDFDDGFHEAIKMNAKGYPYQDVLYINMNYQKRCQHRLQLSARRIYGARVHQGEYQTGQTIHIIMHN